MENILTTGHARNTRHVVRHAAILAAPLWASGLVFLALLFAIARHGDFCSLQFLALSVVMVLTSTVVALRVMDRDLLQHARKYRRMKLRSRRLHGSRLI